MTLERRVVKLETARRARQCAASSELVLVFETEDKATFRLSDGWHECRRADDESFAQFEARALADMRHALGPTTFRVIDPEKYARLKARAEEMF
jgi:hypothetical protein